VLLERMRRQHEVHRLLARQDLRRAVRPRVEVSAGSIMNKDRSLSDGWIRSSRGGAVCHGEGSLCWPFGGGIAKKTPADYWFAPTSLGPFHIRAACESCAESMGVFAKKDETAPIVPTGLTGWMPTVHHEDLSRQEINDYRKKPATMQLANGTSMAAPPPSTVPTCEGVIVISHGVPIDRWCGSLIGVGSRRKLLCDECYLYAERVHAEEMAADDAERAASDKPAPPARVGHVPQSFPDARIGGVWASRGMRRT